MELEGRPEKAWWKVALVDMLTIAVVTQIWIRLGLVSAVMAGVVLIGLTLRWKLGPYRTRAQRQAIHRRAQQQLAKAKQS